MAGLELTSGEVLDEKYRIVSLLGRGGMGCVYAAVRLSLGDTVAVKQLIPSDDDGLARARFLREARAAARIRHPSVVQVFDYGDPPEGAPYIVMEHLEGPTLADEIRSRGRLPLPRALALFSDICAAIEAGHQRGVVHRDIKPGNVILARSDDGGEVPKVLDFGIASLTTELDAATLTNPGAIIGTCHYMAPDQVQGATPGPAADVFSLGVLLYEMTTGELPFAAPTPVGTMMRILAGAFTPPEEVAPDLPEAVLRAIRSALARLPQDRPLSAAALAALAGAPRPSHRRRASVQMEAAVTSSSRSDTGLRAQAARVRDAPALDHFVARAQEIARIEEQHRAALAGAGRLTLVTGEPGVGKTRMVDAFARSAAMTGCTVLWAKFFDYEGSRRGSCEPIVRMLVADPTDVAGFDPRQRERERADRAPDADRWRLFPAVADALERRARDASIVLVFDDVQWASPLELDLITYLHGAAVGTRTFFVATARGDLRGGGGEHLERWMLALAQRRASAVVPVRPLDEEGVREWLVAGFGGFRVRPSDLRRLERTTGGNPHSLLEVVRHLMTAGDIRRQSDGWACRPLDDVALPDSVASLVRANLAGLGADLRGVLEIAAVIGYEFRFETLESATELDEDRLEGLLDEAAKLRLVTEAGVSGDDDYRFTNDTTRHVLYDEMTARKRRRAHQRVVAALHALYQARGLRRIAQVLCYHHHAVGAWQEALSWGLAAAEDALAAHANDAADTALGRARDAADKLAAEGAVVAVADQLKLDRLVGALSARLGRYDDAIERLGRVAAASPSADVAMDLAQAHLGRGDLELALALAREAWSTIGADDATRALAAGTLVGSVLGRLGRSEEAEREIERAMRESGDRAATAQQALALREIGWQATLRGDFARGEQASRRALELARAARDLGVQSSALSALAVVTCEAGDCEGAIPIHLEALALTRALSLRRREAIELANLGEAHYQLGRHAEASERFREALAIFLEIKDRACEGDVRVNLGRTMLAEGDRAEAIKMLEHGRAICESTGRREYQALAWLHLGEAHFASADLDAAEAAAATAHQLFAAQAVHHTWRAALMRARIAAGKGRHAEAGAHARAAEEHLLVLRANAKGVASVDGLDASLESVRQLARGLATEG